MLVASPYHQFKNTAKNAIVKRFRQNKFTAANNDRRLVKASDGRYRLAFESGITSGGNVLSEIFPPIVPSAPSIGFRMSIVYRN
jgi:hypothetical protein